MTDPKDPDDKPPKDPDDVIEAPVKRGPGNPAWVKGVSACPGGATVLQRREKKELKGRIRDWINSEGFPRLIEIAMDEATDPVVASGIILKLTSFVLPPAKVDDVGEDAQGGTETRTMTVTFVAPKKEGS